MIIDIFQRLCYAVGDGWQLSRVLSVKTAASYKLNTIAMCIAYTCTETCIIAIAYASQVRPFPGCHPPRLGQEYWDSLTVGIHVHVQLTGNINAHMSCLHTRYMIHVHNMNHGPLTAAAATASPSNTSNHQPGDMAASLVMLSSGHSAQGRQSR